MSAMDMIRKFVRHLLAFPQKAKHSIRRRLETVLAAEPAVADPACQREPPCVKRIRSVLSCSGVRQRKGSAQGVWTVKAKSFTDAYRFLLRMCDPSLVRTVRQAGYVKYRAELPGGEGSILLSDRVGKRKNTLAVMTFRVRSMPEIRELRFCMRSESLR